MMISNGDILIKDDKAYICVNDKSRNEKTFVHEEFFTVTQKKYLSMKYAGSSKLHGGENRVSVWVYKE